MGEKRKTFFICLYAANTICVNRSNNRCVLFTHHCALRNEAWATRCARWVNVSVSYVSRDCAAQKSLKCGIKMHTYILVNVTWLRHYENCRAKTDSYVSLKFAHLLWRSVVNHLVELRVCNLLLNTKMCVVLGLVDN